jgi:bifunctional non-homologous end joining protein LigD
MIAPPPPMLATLGSLASLSPGVTWRLEGKWDGVRAVAAIDDGELVVRSRTDRDITPTFPELGELPGLLAGRTVTLDGEIVAFDPEGRTNFGLLQQRLGLSGPAVQRVQQAVPVTYLIFDVLTLHGKPLLDRPYDKRREVLDGLGIAGEHCRVPEQLHGTPADVLARTKADDGEGMIAKKSDSVYLPGQRSSAWIKVKNEKDIEVAVIGWEPGQGRRDGMIGSLLLAGAGRVRMAVRRQGQYRLHRQDARRPGGPAVPAACRRITDHRAAATRCRRSGCSLGATGNSR